MMTKKDWNGAKDAWLRIQKQAEIDLEQSKFFIESINIHLNTLPEEEEKEDIGG